MEAFAPGGRNVPLPCRRHEGPPPFGLEITLNIVLVLTTQEWRR
jgi:hypothetical protein